MYSAKGISTYALTAALAVGGCTSNGTLPDDAGTTDSALVDSAPVDAGTTFGESACGACVQKVCAPSIAACAGEPDCVAYLECLLDCPLTKSGNVDPACAAVCPAGTSSAATEDENALSACRTSGPGAVCAGCGGIDGGIAFTLLNETCPKANTGAACSDFFAEHCCVPQDLCLGNPDCSAAVTCYEGCPNDDFLPDAGADAGFFPSCAEGCIGPYPNQRVPFAELYFCVNQVAYIAPACGGMPDPCISCVNANCPQELLDLNEAPGGIGLYDCVTSCGSPNEGSSDVTSEVCEADCQAEFAGAASALEVYLACQINVCPVCVGNGGV